MIRCFIFIRVICCFCVGIIEIKVYVWETYDSLIIFFVYLFNEWEVRCIKEVNGKRMKGLIC